MKALNPQKLKGILSGAGNVLDAINESIQQPEPQTKGLFGKNDEIAALEAQVAEKDAAAEKQKKTMMYIVIAAVVLLLFGKKLMK